MSTTTQDPPAAAVSKDAHWSAKMDRLRSRKPLSLIVTYLDDATADALREAQAAVNVAQRKARGELAESLGIPRDEVDPQAIEDHKDVKAARRAVVRAEKAHDAANVVLELRGLPGDVFDALMAEHPPTEDQEGRGETYNIDRLAPELVAASCTDDMTPRQAAELIGGEYYDEDRGERTDDDAWVRVTRQIFTTGEASYLYESAVKVNQNARVTLGKGSGPTRS